MKDRTTLTLNNRLKVVYNILLKEQKNFSILYWKMPKNSKILNIYFKMLQEVIAILEVWNKIWYKRWVVLTLLLRKSDTRGYRDFWSLWYKRWVVLAFLLRERDTRGYRVFWSLKLNLIQEVGGFYALFAKFVKETSKNLIQEVTALFEVWN